MKENVFFEIRGINDFPKAPGLSLEFTEFNQQCKNMEGPFPISPRYSIC